MPPFEPRGPIHVVCCTASLVVVVGGAAAAVAAASSDRVACVSDELVRRSARLINERNGLREQNKQCKLLR
jgi:hypothetical protein